MQALNWKAAAVAAVEIMIAAVIAGCHGLPQKIDETAVWSTDKLYSEAQDALSGGDWSKCAKYFELLEGRDPFGKYTQQAQLNVAYCHWKDNETAAAEIAIDRFIQLHPNHPDIDYAYYLKGLINFNDNLGLFGRFSGQDLSERDPKALSSSYQAFKTIVDRYPKSRYAPDAAQRMRYIVNALASHEMHVADYYYRRGAYLAAINRVQSALKHYPNAPANEDALYIMVLSYRAIGQQQLADDAMRVLQSTFPHSPYLSGKPPRIGNKPWWQIW